MKKSSLLFLSTLMLGGCLAGFVGSNLSIMTRADGEFALDKEFEEIYAKDVILDVPTGRFGDKIATAYLQFPSGNCSLATNVKLTEHGDYTVKYIYDDGSKVLSHIENFKVKNPLYSFSGNNSSAAYTKNDLITGREGINVELAQGETISFNQPINLNNYNDKNAPFYFTIAPQKEGSFDAKTMYMRLTDVYDANNFVEIKMSLNEDPTTTCWEPALGKANNQAYKGWNYSGTKPVLWTNQYGTYCEISPFKTYQNGKKLITDIYESQKFSMWVDSNTNELYFIYYSINSKLDVSAMMVDLDDGSYQDEIFKGFKTGEVYLSFRAAEYQTQTCNVQFLKCGEAELNSKFISDDEAPNIVLKNEYEENPVGIKGYYFPVNEAEAKDSFCGSLYCDVNVYFNYNRTTGTYYTKSDDYDNEISIVDGYFSTKKEGVYSIVYSSVDYSGNYVEKVVNVTVKTNKYPIRNIVLEDNYKTSGEVNNFVYLPKVVSFAGGKGNIISTYEIIQNGNKVQILGNEINGFYFIPRVTGEYSVKVTVIDTYKESGSVDYTFVADPQTVASFEKDVELPKYLMTDCDYKLPKYYGKNVQGNYELAQVEVSDGAGTRVLNSENSVRFTPNGSGIATIVYFFGNNKVSYTLPVIQAKEDNKVALLNYFKTDSVTKSLVDLGVLLNGEDKGQFEFINPILLSDFNFIFSVDSFEGPVAKVKFYLTDSVDASEQISFEFEISNEIINVYLNDKLIQTEYSGGLVYPSQAKISFSNKSLVLSIGSTISVVVDKTTYDKDFVGFTSQKVYISGDFTGKTNIIFESILNQPLTAMGLTDNRAPALIIDGEYTKLLQASGDVFHIFGTIAGDVLSPYTSSTVTLTNSSYQPVKDLDGHDINEFNTLDGATYDAILNELGVYTLTYTAKDWSNRRYTYSLQVNVKDMVKPVIYIDGEMPTSGTVGTITLPSIIAKDDVSENCTLIIAVYSPSGDITYVKDGKFTANEVGTYLIDIIAIDDNGNSTNIKFNMEVK